MSVREIDGVESESIMSHQLVALACRFGVYLLLRPEALVSSEIIAHCLFTVRTHNTNCACIRESAAYSGAESYICKKKHISNLRNALKTKISLESVVAFTILFFFSFEQSDM